MIQKTFLKTKDYCKVKFSIDANGAETVNVLGLNNDWKTGFALKKKKDGIFTAEINLPKESRHEFKYLIDGNIWADDENADAHVPNTFGGSNSLLVL
jgi:1,4-alpha-glucan branching enzyme